MSKWRDLKRLRDCSEGQCGVPSGFYRLNYFHGKEMRLADYVDEQRYHAGRMRFHNEKLHGAGILCGLGLGVLQPEGTRLRVGRGAAIDDCGREIVVGYDQCVDVAAWFRQQAYEFRDQDDNPCEPDETNRVKLCVVMRYSECGGAPEPVPANPCGPPDPCSCGCGSKGPCACADPCNEVAEFGRVTEEFELKLMFADEAKALTEHRLFPTREAIDTALGTLGGAAGLLSALAPDVRSHCPGADQGWLLLGCFYVLVEADKPEEVVAIDGIDIQCASQILLSSEVIQYLLAGMFAEIGADLGGPEIYLISFRAFSGNRYQFALRLSAAIDPETLDPEANFGLRKLTETGWDHPAGAALEASYSEVIAGEAIYKGPTIYLTFRNEGGFLEEGGKYQLYAKEDADPVVDGLLRRLRPRHLSWRFCLHREAPGDDLSMQPLGV